MEVNVHLAKTHVSKLIQQAENGEEVIIARDGKPAVKSFRCSRKSRRQSIAS